MILRFAGSVFLAAIFAASACAETYKIDAARSTIAFKVRQFINTTNGRFKNFGGTIEVDTEHPEKSSVTVSIDVKSIDTNIRKRDDHLLSAEFFDAASFPEISFKSRSVKRTGPQSGDIVGDFTMHGVTRPITLHVTLATPAKTGQSTERPHWQVTTEPLNRRDFNLQFSPGTESISGISKDVTVKIDIEAVKSR